MPVTLSRRALGAGLGGSIVTAAGGRQASAARKIRLRYGTAFPADHPGVTCIQQAAKVISQQTNGAVTLHVFPNGQLGGEADMFSQVRSGALDFMSTSGANQTVVKIGWINVIAFAFENYSQVWAAMDGDLGNHVRDAFSKVGIHAMPKMLDNGFRNITSGARQIRNPADLKGFKIRVPGNDLWVSAFRALGAAPTTIDFSELYAALQTHLVDGEENPLPLINSAKLYEVQKYISMTGHIWDGHYIFANKPRWDRLPPDVQAIMTKALDDAALQERQDIVTLTGSLVTGLTKKGETFNYPDKKPFRDLLRQAGFYAHWKKQFGNETWSLLEKYSGPL